MSEFLHVIRHLARSETKGIGNERQGLPAGASAFDQRPGAMHNEDYD